MLTIVEPARELPVCADVDVVVCGGGPGGLPAAIAAARHGAKTLLIERWGFLGGLVTAGLQSSISGVLAHNSTQPIVAGLVKEMAERMHTLGGSPAWSALETSKTSSITDEIFAPGGAWKKEVQPGRALTFEAEAFKRVADMMVDEAGVQLLLHTLVTDAIVEDGNIRAVIVENKSGRQAVTAKVVIDATGDADVAFRAGAPTRKGRDFDGAVQAMGSIFIVGGLSPLTEEQHEIAREKMRRALEAGRLHLYNLRVPRARTGEDYARLNVTRWGGDPTNTQDLTRAEVGIRRDIWDLVSFLREEVPGYESCYVRATSQVGPRESRQIVGEYTLTREDVISGKKSEDAIARGSYFVDIHCPLGETYPVYLCVSDCPKQERCPFWVAEHKHLLPRKELYPPEGGWYDIPYGCLLPRCIDNLLASGRCISATHEGMASARVVGTCMAIGQAAGTAAALAVQQGLRPRDLDVQGLRRVLRADGALV